MQNNICTQTYFDTGICFYTFEKKINIFKILYTKYMGEKKKSFAYFILSIELM